MARDIRVINSDVFATLINRNHYLKSGMYLYLGPSSGLSFKTSAAISLHQRSFLAEGVVNTETHKWIKVLGIKDSGAINSKWDIYIIPFKVQGTLQKRNWGGEKSLRLG